MRKVTVSSSQEKVNRFFQSQSSFWEEVYSSEGVFATLIQDRHAAILNWINGLALTPDSCALEVGCGAGFMAVALAQHGFRVQAIDSVEAMVESARQHAAENGVSERLSVNIGDAYALPFEDNTFDFVVAIGVIPWLERPKQAIQEWARVTKPDGYIILTVANPLGLSYVLDPLVNPGLRPLREGAKAVLERVGFHRRSPGMAFHGRHYMNKALSSVGLVKIKDRTLGFNFSLFRHQIIPEPQSTALYRRLQRSAMFSSLGSSYQILARKSASLSGTSGFDA